LAGTAGSAQAQKFKLTSIVSDKVEICKSIETVHAVLIYNQGAKLLRPQSHTFTTGLQRPHQPGFMFLCGFIKISITGFINGQYE
jgi:hypothetical protein